MSSGTLERLVRMANQIAAEFDNQQPGNAAEATCDHLRHFWDPRMKAGIIDHWLAGAAGLSPSAAAAVVRLMHCRTSGAQMRATEMTDPRTSDNPSDSNRSAPSLSPDGLVAPGR